MVKAHQTLSHGSRVRHLAALLAEIIERHTDGMPVVRCLDVGCGDMTLAEQIQERYPRITWHCIDIYELPSGLSDEERWKKYSCFDGHHLPFDDKTFDIVLFCDVLHHSGTEVRHLLSEAARVADFVLVKDHFEGSAYSRLMLWLMDIVGNWGYGVALPRRYFSYGSFQRLAGESKLEFVEMKRGIDLYAHLPLIRNLFRSSWQFIALLKDTSSTS